MMSAIDFVENIPNRNLTPYEKQLIEVIANLDKDYIYIPYRGRGGWTRYAKVKRIEAKKELKYSTMGKRADMIILDEGFLSEEEDNDLH